MSDLIDREKFIYTLIFSEKTKSIFVKDLRNVIEVANEMPSAEPEQKIIYCKDCKFYTPMNRKLKIGICSMTMHHLGDDGFCSTAEKRGE